ELAELALRLRRAELLPEERHDARRHPGLHFPEEIDADLADEHLALDGIDRAVPHPVDGAVAAQQDEERLLPADEELHRDPYDVVVSAHASPPARRRQDTGRPRAPPWGCRMARHRGRRRCPVAPRTRAGPVAPARERPLFPGAAPTDRRSAEKGRA